MFHKLRKQAVSVHVQYTPEITHTAAASVGVYREYILDEFVYMLRKLEA